MQARRYLLRPAARLRRSRRIATAAPERLWLFDLDNTLHDTSHAIFPLIDRGMTEAVAETLAVDEATANRLRAEYWRRYGATVIGLVRHHGVDADAFLHRSHNFEVAPLVRAETALADKLRRLPGRKVLLTNVPIMLGVIAAFGVDKRSNIAAGIMIIVAQATSIWNVGIQTAAAQNLLTVGFMDKMLGERVAWSDWLIAGVPWSLLMSAVLVFVVLRLLPPESDAIAGGKEAVEASLRELGPMTSAQKRLILVSIMLLLFWSTEGKLHKFDTTSTTYFGLVLLMLPRFGVMTWKDVQTRIPWGAVIVFGVGISLGTALLTTQAGQWLGAQVVAHTGLDHLGPLGIFAILSAFLILIHLGFASATALTSAMLPILIAVLQTLPGDFNRLGMTMLLGFVVSYGFILPINAPQNMVALGTETFTAKQFAKVGIVLTIVGYLLMLLMSVTYWRWLGWM